MLDYKQVSHFFCLADFKQSGCIAMFITVIAILAKFLFQYIRKLPTVT